MSAHPAPTDLCYALQQGQLCYVSRMQPTDQQSLCLHTRDEMEARGYRSSVIHLSTLSGSPHAQTEWAKQLIKELWYTFYPSNRGRLSQWLESTESLSSKERLIQFSHDLFLSELCEAPMTILIDTIDPLANVPNAISDLFAWIDYCYELRDTYLSYHHLSFAVFSQANLVNLNQPKMAYIQASPEYFKSFCAMSSLSAAAIRYKLTSHHQLSQNYLCYSG